MSHLNTAYDLGAYAALVDFEKSAAFPSMAGFKSLAGNPVREGAKALRASGKSGLPLPGMSSVPRPRSDWRSQLRFGDAPPAGMSGRAGGALPSLENFQSLVR